MAQYLKKHVAASPDPVSLGMPSVRGRVLALGETFLRKKHNAASLRWSGPCLAAPLWHRFLEDTTNLFFRWLASLELLSCRLAAMLLFVAPSAPPCEGVSLWSHLLVACGAWDLTLVRLGVFVL